MSTLMSFSANFFRRHTPESMARLLAFCWFLVATGYATITSTPDVAIFGLMSANCLTCLGLRSKPVSTESAGATADAS
jgi:hypothetical protein